MKTNRSLHWSWGLLFLAVTAFAQENQNDELKKLASGSYAVYKTVEKSPGVFKFESTSKPWPVELKKTGDEYTEITIMRAGVVAETFSADLPGFPAYYKNATETVVTAIDKSIYYYTYSIKTGSKIVYILSEKSPSKYDTEKEKLDAYRIAIKSQQTETRNVRIEEKNAAEAKLAAENTLKDKNIKAIRISTVNPPAEIGMLSIVSIGMEAELDNGTILRTKNLGGYTPYTDFETEVVGGEYSGGDFKVAADSRKITNDKIEIVAWSKYQPGVKGSLAVPINYKSDINFAYHGAGGTFGRGRTVGYSENGGDGKHGQSVRVVAELKTINNTQVNHIKIIHAVTGELLTEAKLNISHTMNINTSGGNGGNGVDGRDCFSGNGGSGGNGGDGGDVHLTGSGVSSLKINVTSKGGSGGRGGSRKTTTNTNGTNGSNGRDGTFYK